MDAEKSMCASCQRLKATRYGLLYVLDAKLFLFLCTLCKNDQVPVPCMRCGTKSTTPYTIDIQDSIHTPSTTTNKNKKMPFCTFDCANAANREWREKGMSHRYGRYCQGCGIPGKHYKMCGGCGRVYYCTVDCQRAHWSTHRTECKRSEAQGDAKEVK